MLATAKQNIQIGVPSLTRYTMTALMPGKPKWLIQSKPNTPNHNKPFSDKYLKR